MTLVLLTALLSSTAFADDSLKTWVIGVDPPVESLALAQQLPGAPGAIPPAVPAALTAHSQQALAAQASSMLAKARTTCTPQTTISFVQEALQATDPVSAHYFDSTIHMRSIFCLEAGTAAQALATFRTAAYRISALPLITSFKVDGDQTCVDTRSVLGGAMPPTAICSRTTTHTGVDFHGVVAWLTENTGGPEHQAAYYRHMVVVFIDRPGGGVAGFRGVVTRSKDLGMLQRTLIHATAGKAEEMMQERLNTLLLQK